MKTSVDSRIVYTFDTSKRMQKARESLAVSVKGSHHVVDMLAEGKKLAEGDLLGEVFI